MMPTIFCSDFDPFAWFYNRYWSPAFCQWAFPTIEQLLLRKLSPGSRILDLCCGTGHITRELLRRGFRVTGVDLSEEMLRFARHNASQAELICADVRTIELPPVYDAVISAYCSLNHMMTEDDLRRALQCAGASLSERGLLLFDINTESGYRANWKDYTLVETEHACFVQTTYEPKARIGRADITLFHVDTSHATARHWLRRDFSICQRCYTEKEVRTALTDACFHKILVRDAKHAFDLPGGGGLLFIRSRKQFTYS